MNQSDLKWPDWPHYGKEEEEAVKRVILSNQLFADKEVRKFEEEFEKRQTYYKRLKSC